MMRQFRRNAAENQARRRRASMRSDNDQIRFPNTDQLQQRVGGISPEGLARDAPFWKKRRHELAAMFGQSLRFFDCRFPGIVELSLVFCRMFGPSTVRD